MKNNTFNQVINANLASIDPGFGQFALAKASSDLFKKVLNKEDRFLDGRQGTGATAPRPSSFQSLKNVGGCRGSKRTRGLPLFTYAGYPSSTARLRAAARSRGPRVT